MRTDFDSTTLFISIHCINNVLFPFLSINLPNLFETFTQYIGINIVNNSQHQIITC
jgi:hypothetical protein